MKKLQLTLAFLVANLAFADAQSPEVAVMNIKIGKDKKLRTVVIEFYDTDAPATVANFKKLASKGFYNGIAFHRVFADSMVQTGDPLSKNKDRLRVGTGGPGFTLPPEIRRNHQRGSVVMARLPDKINPARRSSGSQFYIALKPMPELDGKYTVFGRVISGFEALEEISRLSVDTNDYPIERVIIRSIKIQPRAPVAAGS